MHMAEEVEVLCSAAEHTMDTSLQFTVPAVPEVALWHTGARTLPGMATKQGQGRGH